MVRRSAAPHWVCQNWRSGRQWRSRRCRLRARVPRCPQRRPSSPRGEGLAGGVQEVEFRHGGVWLPVVGVKRLQAEEPAASRLVEADLLQGGAGSESAGVDGLNSVRRSVAAGRRVRAKSSSGRSWSRMGAGRPARRGFSGPSKSRTTNSFVPARSQGPGTYIVCDGPMFQKRPRQWPLTQTTPLPHERMSRKVSPGCSTRE